MNSVGQAVKLRNECLDLDYLSGPWALRMENEASERVALHRRHPYGENKGIVQRQVICLYEVPSIGLIAFNPLHYSASETAWVAMTAPSFCIWNFASYYRLSRGATSTLFCSFHFSSERSILIIFFVSGPFDGSKKWEVAPLSYPKWNNQIFVCLIGLSSSLAIEQKENSFEDKWITFWKSTFLCLHQVPQLWLMMHKLLRRFSNLW